MNSYTELISEAVKYCIADVYSMKKLWEDMVE